MVSLTCSSLDRAVKTSGQELYAIFKVYTLEYKTMVYLG